jgi:hypothetical protein
MDRDTSGWEIVKDRLWGFGHQIGVIEPQSNDSLWDQRSSSLAALLIWSALKRGNFRIQGFNKPEWEFRDHCSSQGRMAHGCQLISLEMSCWSP